MITDTYGVITRARITKTLLVEITASPAGITCEWIGERPPKLNARQFARYRAARNKAIAELAERMGGTGLLLETGSITTGRKLFVFEPGNSVKEQPMPDIVTDGYREH